MYKRRDIMIIYFVLKESDIVLIVKKDKRIRGSEDEWMKGLFDVEFF